MIARGQPTPVSSDSAAQASRTFAECALDIAISKLAGDVAVVEIRGEVDAACADQLRDALKATASSTRRIVVDFSQASFIDLAGLKAMLPARGDAAAPRLAVANLDQQTLPLFRVVETAGLFETYPTVPAALDGA